MNKINRVIFFGFLVLSACISSSSTMDRMIVLFKTNWKNSFSGYELQSRGPGKGLISKLGIECKMDRFHKYQYDSLYKAFRFSPDEKFISDTCIIDVKDPEINALIKLFDEMALYKLVATHNDFGIVELSISEDETIYYIDNLDLPMSTKSWLSKFSHEIDSNFFYVKGTESIWSSIK